MMRSNIYRLFFNNTATILGKGHFVAVFKNLVSEEILVMLKFPTRQPMKTPFDGMSASAQKRY